MLRKIMNVTCKVIELAVLVALTTAFAYVIYDSFVWWHSLYIHSSYWMPIWGIEDYASSWDWNMARFVMGLGICTVCPLRIKNIVLSFIRK